MGRKANNNQKYKIAIKVLLYSEKLIGVKVPLIFNYIKPSHAKIRHDTRYSKTPDTGLMHHTGKLTVPM